MNNEELKATREHYRDNLTRHLNSFESVDWGSVESQEARFSVLTDIYKAHPPKTLLDVGCGLGGLYAYLIERGQAPCYTGLDICPEMVETMLRRLPDAQGITHNLLESPLEQTWDMVVCSGIFNRCGSDDDAYTRTMITRMWAATTSTLAWNMLSTKADLSGIAKTTRLNDPDYWRAFALELSPKVRLLHDYLPHDFTLIIER